jgi:hypothetical protein
LAGGDDLVDLVPAAAHEAAHAAHLLVVAPGLVVLDDGGPGVHRRLGVFIAARQRSSRRPRTIGYFTRLALYRYQL